MKTIRTHGQCGRIENMFKDVPPIVQADTTVGNCFFPAAEAHSKKLVEQWSSRLRDLRERSEINCLGLPDFPHPINIRSRMIVTLTVGSKVANVRHSKL